MNTTDLVLLLSHEDYPSTQKYVSHSFLIAVMNNNVLLLFLEKVYRASTIYKIWMPCKPHAAVRVDSLFPTAISLLLSGFQYYFSVLQLLGTVLHVDSLHRY